MGQSLLPVAYINNWKDIKMALSCFLATQLQNCLQWLSRLQFSILHLIYSLCSNHPKQAAMFTAEHLLVESPRKSDQINSQSSFLWIMSDTPVKTLNML